LEWDGKPSPLPLLFIKQVTFNMEKCLLMAHKIVSL
jgi:hypothetical protein